MKRTLIPVTTGSIEDYCSARTAADTKGVSVRAVYDALDAEKLTGYELHGQTVLKTADVEAWEPRLNKRRKAAKAVKGEASHA